MKCEEVKTAKYQTRKSPPFHAAQCPEQTKKGKDGTYMSKEGSNGVYKWVKVGSNTKGVTRKAGKSYLIHDNGARPYKVQVSGKTVDIYKGEYRKLSNNTMDYTKLVKSLTVKEIHVGKSPCIDAADGCGASFVGNTLLLHISGKKYMHVGRDIFEFTIDDEFDTYYSLVGNNDVPYPVLLGSKNVYFMLDRETLPREVFTAKMNAAEWADAYTYFYGMKDLDTGELLKCDQKGIKERKICVQERGEKAKAIAKKYVKKMKTRSISA
jgi:hypothetical protein